MTASCNAKQGKSHFYYRLMLARRLNWRPQGLFPVPWGNLVSWWIGDGVPYSGHVQGKVLAHVIESCKTTFFFFDFARLNLGLW
jgi:hypothetical protein